MASSYNSKELQVLVGVCAVSAELTAISGIFTHFINYIQIIPIKHFTCKKKYWGGLNFVATKA